MGNTLLVPSSPRAYIAHLSVSHSNRRCWFGWSMFPASLCCPSPWMPPAAPAPACIHRGSNNPPFTFPAAVVNLQTSIIPSSLSSPSISSLSWKGSIPSVVLAALLGTCSNLHCPPQDNENKTMYYYSRMMQFGAESFQFSWTMTHSYNLAAGQSSQMLLP